MTRVLFIRTGYSTQADTVPPLGLLSLCSVLRQETGAECAILDPLAEPMSTEELVGRARGFGPDFIGLSAFSCQASAFHKTARALREGLPNAVMIAGGPYPTTQPKEALADSSLDVCVLGEGERTLPDLLRTLRDGRPLSEVRGIAYRDNVGIRQTDPADWIENLDELPYPAYDLIDLGLWERLARIGSVRKHNRYVTMFSSRGCPYQCTFCHRLFGKKYRARSVGSVLAEIDWLVREWGVREVQFSDDAFNMDRERTIDICRGLVERGSPVALSFPNGLRADLLDEETVDWLARAGTYKAAIAIESASGRIQRAIRKNLDLEKAARAIEFFAKRRVITNGFFMFGFPTETLDEMRETLRFARRSALHSVAFFFAQPLPGTQLYEEHLSFGGPPLPTADFGSYFDPPRFRYAAGTADPKAMARLVRRGWIRFQLNPVRMARIVRDMPNRRQIFRLLPFFFARSFLPRLEGRLSLSWRKKALRRSEKDQPI